LVLSSFPRRKNTGALELTYIDSLAEITGSNPACGTDGAGGSGQTAFFAPLRCAKQRVSPFALGSIRSVRAEDKSSLASFEYKPYGALHASSGSLDLNIEAALGAFEDESHLALAAEGLPTAQPSAGHRWDPDVQQYFAPYRYYSPTTARWLTRDPLGMVDGPNVYGYVGGRPTAMTDSDGLFRVPIPGIGAVECDGERVALCVLGAIAFDIVVDELCVKSCKLCLAHVSPYNPGCIVCTGCAVALIGIIGTCVYMACDICKDE